MSNCIEVLEAISTIVELSLRQGRREEAEKSLLDLEDKVQKIKSDYAYAYLFTSRGLASLAASDYPSAASNLEQAVQLWRKISWSYFLGRALYYLAVTYIQSGADEGRAAQALDEAIEIFTKLDAKLALNKALKTRKDLAQISRVHFETPQKPRPKVIFEILMQAFVEDYFVRRISVERSGWRTLVEISKSAKIPASSLYGRRGAGTDSVFVELQKAHLLERRVVWGQRGRGGEITQFRLSYESNQDLKKYVDSKATLKSFKLLN